MSRGRGGVPARWLSFPLSFFLINIPSQRERERERESQNGIHLINSFIHPFIHSLTGEEEFRRNEGGGGERRPPGGKVTYTRLSLFARLQQNLQPLRRGPYGMRGGGRRRGLSPASLCILTRKYMRYAYICAPAPEARSARPQRGG